MCPGCSLLVKVNPAFFCHYPHDILKHFPNINTMIVHSLKKFKETDVPP